MDRLLSDEEICKACPAVNMRTTEHLQLRCHPDNCIVIADFKGIAKAQLAKADADWVEFIESIISGAGLNLTYIKTKDWQERKRSVSRE